jgi:hypothetical protein
MELHMGLTFPAIAQLNWIPIYVGDAGPRLYIPAVERQRPTVINKNLESLGFLSTGIKLL